MIENIWRAALAELMGRTNALAELMNISPPARCRNATSFNAAIPLQSVLDKLHGYSPISIIYGHR
jgi:hypothetical protein